MPYEPKGSGGGGEDLPSIGSDVKAGNSGISGLGLTLPSLMLRHYKDIDELSTVFSRGSGPTYIDLMEPIPCYTAVKTDSLVSWGGYETKPQRKQQPRQPQQQEQQQEQPGAMQEEHTRRDFRCEAEDLEKAHKRSTSKERKAARREGRHPRAWNSHPASFTPIMKNAGPVDAVKMRTPWVELDKE